MLKSIDTTIKHQNGALRAFITVTIDKQDYEDFIDLPLNVTDAETYIKAHIEDIEADILEQFLFDEDYSYDAKKSKLENIKQVISDKKISVKPFQKHPEIVMSKIKYDKAKTIEEKLEKLAEAVFK